MCNKFFVVPICVIENLNLSFMYLKCLPITTLTYSLDTIVMHIEFPPLFRFLCKYFILERNFTVSRIEQSYHYIKLFTLKVRILCVIYA